jgi:UDP-N-acetylglucosamine--N-acetylmuramyl-(pentapeptide) pyrophosphoryl-undecaprenol N-acetylglucosamine transferase
MSARHLMVVAAGTAGHVMPGLAVAEALRARGWSVSWLGTRAGMERSLVEPRGIAFEAIDFAGLRGKGITTLLTGGFKLLRALGQSLSILRARRPAVVFSTGGYVAVPAGFATALTGSPLVLLNADAAALLSTRLLKSLAAAICCGFDGSAARLAGAKALVSGNPVRPDIARLDAPAARYAGRDGALDVLVIGGSLGARVLNETMPAALALLAPGQRPRVVHQCGAAHADATRAAYAAAGVEAEVLPFIDDIAARYAAADVVICRAGAITVSELCAAGVPAVLVPLVVRTTTHQRSNAQWLAGHGAGIHLPQDELQAPRLAEMLRTLTRERLLAMADKARALGRPHATTLVADAIEHIERARSQRAPAAGGR